jgi:hypothetical protein
MRPAAPFRAQGGRETGPLRFHTRKTNRLDKKKSRCEMAENPSKIAHPDGCDQLVIAYGNTWHKYWLHSASDPQTKNSGQAL